MIALARRPLVVLTVCLVAALAVAGIVTVTRSTTTRPTAACPAHRSSVGIAPGSRFVSEAPRDLDRDLDVMKTAGVGWLRVAFQWPDLEPQRGQFRWEAVDRVVAGAIARCIDIDALLTYTAEWATPPDCRGRFCGPANADDYGRFAGAAAEHFHGRVHTWELWNEPNVPAFFAPAPNATRYGAMVAAAARTIHQVDAMSIVLSGGLASHAASDSAVPPDEFLRAALSARTLGDVDGIAYHPYCFPLRPSQSTGSNPFADGLPALRRTLDSIGGATKPIWLTEFGVPTGGAGAVSEDRQAADIDDAFSLRSTIGPAGPLFWYTLHDAADGDAVDNQFGLLDRTGRSKPALKELARVARRMT